MRVGDTEIIRRPTQVASRNMLVILATIILVKYYDTPLDDLKILNAPLPGDLLDAVAVVLIGFGIFSLLVHWASDVVAWRMWVDGYRQLIE